MSDFQVSVTVDMLKNPPGGKGEAPDAIGIVVQSGRPATPPAKPLGFAWGKRVLPAPSLPFGRWKVMQPAA